jgi:hypothetical protein
MPALGLTWRLVQASHLTSKGLERSSADDNADLYMALSERILSA